MNNLDNRYYDVIVAEMNGFFEENGFKTDENLFKNEKKALKIEYNEEKQLYNLYSADVSEGEIGEFSLVSSYLFDESQTKNDAVSVAIDFIDEARKTIGARAKRQSVSAELPTATGSAVNVNTLTSKFLAIYPALKDIYKIEVASKGKYLYLDFCTRFVVPEVRKTLDAKNKKATKKLIDMLISIFVEGDRASVNLTVAILSSAIGKDGERFNTAVSFMDDCPPLVQSINRQIAVMAKNKKFAKAVGFEE